MTSLLELPHYESIDAFYDAVPEHVRRRSGESDFGCWWYDGEQAWSGCWRISCVEYTGEIYAIKERASRHTPQLPVGVVVVLGSVGPDVGYERSHAALAGWENVCGVADSLQWAIDALAPFRAAAAPATAPELPTDRYDAGFVAGLAAYAHWSHGEQYVGTTGRTLKEATARFRETWNYSPPSPDPNDSTPAELVVDAVLEDLLRRKGIRNELEGIEPEIYAEMRAELAVVVADALAAPGQPG